MAETDPRFRIMPMAGGVRATPTDGLGHSLKPSDCLRAADDARRTEKTRQSAQVDVPLLPKANDQNANSVGKSTRRSLQPIREDDCVETTTGPLFAYLTNLYPRPSLTFIRREIRALERAGLRVHRLSVRGDREALADSEDLVEHDRTERLLDAGALGLAAAAIERLVRSPRRFAAALHLAIRIGWRSERGLPRHLVYLLEACRLTTRCQALGVAHIHVHFGTNPATVAMLGEVLGGPSWSLTIHGPEEFDKPDFIALGEKTRRAAFVVAISSFCSSQIRRWMDFDRWNRIRIVRCGVEIEPFGKACPVDRTSQTLVCVGRLSEQKGQLLLVQALANLAPRRPELRLRLVGDGEMRSAIEMAARSLGVFDRISITGWMDGEGVRRELAGARALVLPSFAEGLPVVIMEAMAARRPVISTYVAGIPELVVPGETGWLVPAGDVEALTMAMEACIDATTETLQAMGDAASKRVLRFHHIDHEASRLAEHLADAVGVAPR